MSKFKFCKDDGTWEWKKLHPNDKGYDDGLATSNSLREIAYQLKRIADILGTKFVSHAKRERREE